MTTLIEAVGVTKHFPVRGGGWLHRRTTPLRAVENVSLQVGTGETLGLVGESGCGKSTLGRLMINLIKTTSGSIYFSGTEISTLPAREMREMRKAMQIIFQDPYGALNPRMTVEEIIAEPLLIHGEKFNTQTHEKIASMVATVGLPRRSMERFPHEFSGGQRQRIGIARALILRPRFVVCDEPVSALDVSVQAQIVNLLRDIQRELSLTYLFIAHDLAVVKHISDRVAVMYLGKIVEIAKKLDLYSDPLHPYTRALIAAVPVDHPRHRSTDRKQRQRLLGDLPSPLNPPTGCRFHTRCPHAMARCREAEPPMLNVSPGRQVACYLHEQN